MGLGGVRAQAAQSAPPLLSGTAVLPWQDRQGRARNGTCASGQPPLKQGISCTFLLRVWLSRVPYLPELCRWGRDLPVGVHQVWFLELCRRGVPNTLSEPVHSTTRLF